MGREIRRVPPDFHLSHPVDQTWPGFLNPYCSHSTDCAACSGSGYSPTAARFNREWYGAIHDDVDFDPRSTGSEPFDAAHPTIVAIALRNVGMSAASLEAIRTELAEELYLPADLRFESRRLAAHFNASWSHHLCDADVAVLVAADRLMDFTRRPRTPEQAAALLAQVTPENPHPYWLAGGNGYIPSAAEVNEWSLGGFGHDSINAWVCIKARCSRLGVPTSCAECEGTGTLWDEQAIPVSLDPWGGTDNDGPLPAYDPAVYLSSELAAESWTPVDPPSGTWYQLWETVSEGSPISPAFETAQELARYLCAFDVWGSTESDYETWLRFIRGPGWAPSFMSTPESGLVSGVEFFGRESDSDE